MCAKDMLKILDKIIKLHNPCVTIEEDESIPNRFYIENGILKLNDFPIAKTDDILSIRFRVPFDRASGKVMFVIKMRRFVMCITFSEKTEKPEIAVERQFKEYFVFANGRNRFEMEIDEITYTAENLVFDYSSTKTYYLYHNKCISDFIERYEDIKEVNRLKTLYADIAFINNDSGFDKTLAITFIKSCSTVFQYINHLWEYMELIEEKDIKKIIDDVIEHEMNMPDI